MANKIANRGISVYIDGSKVIDSVKGMKREMTKLTNEQAKMVYMSDEYIAHARKIARLDNILQKHKDYQKGITKEYGKMQKGASGFFNSFQVFLGNVYTKGLQLLINTLGDAVDKIRSFEKANSVLASILGVNKKEVKELSESAIALGKNSKYTASQVTDLQTELAKLGFNKKQIQDSQKYILDFATALDASLADAATLAGSSLRAFGAQTTETQRYVDAMTAAANQSAIGFEYLATAMPIVAPVAKAFNFSIEDTLALLGKLSDSGFDASSAATSLRNILLNLADSNGKLAKALGGPVTNLNELVTGFKKLQDEGIDLATALELTDKRSVAAFQTFLQASDGLLELRDSLREAGGEAERVANDQMNNLDGSILTLKSSWEALMLSMSGSSGILKKAVDGLTAIVDKLIWLSNAAKDLQDTDFYKDSIKERQKNATVEYELKLISGVEGDTYDLLEGYDKDFFENAVNYNYRVNKEILENQLSEFSKLQEDAQKELDKITEENNKSGVAGYLYRNTIIGAIADQSEYDAEKELNKAILRVDDVKARINALNEAYDSVLKKDILVGSDTDTGGGGGSGNGSGDKTSVQRKEINDAKIKLEIDYQNELIKIKKSYQNGDILSEEAYNEEMLKLQDKYDKERIAKLQDLQKTTSDPQLKLDLAKQIADIEAKALDRQITDREKKQKAATKQEQDLLKWNEEETKKIIESSLKYVATEEDKAYVKQMELRAQGKISEAEYQKEITNIQMRYLEERLRINGLTEKQIAEIRREILENEVKTLQDTESKRNSLLGDDIYLQLTEQMKTIDDALLSGAVTFGEAVLLRVNAYLDTVNQSVQTIGNNLSGAMDNFASAEESAVSRKYDKQIAAAEGNAKKQKRLEEKKQKELNAVKAKYADKQFAVTVAQTISTTALAAIQAYQAAMSLGPIGFVLGPIMAAAAIAYGASQIAVAKEQRDAAKEGYYKGGYYIDEGYTGGGDPKQVRGYLPDGSPVHGKEFIANHATTSMFSPLFDVFDEAQKHNTVSSISKRDLAKALNISTGYYQGGYNGSASSSPTIIRDSRYDEAYERFTDVLERLEEKMDTPFKGYVTYKGDDGIEEAQNLDEKMMKNISR